MANSSPAPLDPFAPPTANLDPRLIPDGAGGQLAGRWTRFGARMLDGLLFMPLLVIGAFVGIFLRSAPFDPAALKSPARMLGLFAAVFIACLPLAIYQWYLETTTGQSLGKRWSKIKIVKLDGSPVDFVSAVLLRTWVPFLAGTALTAIGLQSIGNIYNSIDALAIFTTQRRCLHDLIAGTKVITLEQL